MGGSSDSRIDWKEMMLGMGVGVMGVASIGEPMVEYVGGGSIEEVDGEGTGMVESCEGGIGKGGGTGGVGYDSVGR